MDGAVVAEKIKTLFQASAILPYDTGALMRSITTKQLSETHFQVIIGDEVGDEEVIYAPFLEYCVNVGRSDKPNKHRFFVEGIMKLDIIPYLRRLKK